MKATSEPLIYDDVIDMDDDSIDDAYLYSAEKYHKYVTLLYFNSYMDTSFESLSNAKTYAKRYFPELLI